MKPWQGIVVATATPFNTDLTIDFGRYADHCRWLLENGCDGVAPNGSLGEYQALEEADRIRLIEVAVQAMGDKGSVVAGVGAYSGHESRRWAERAADLGAGAVLALPPNGYRANDAEVVAHYLEVAKAGLPIVAYNNPFDTRVDLTPALLARVADQVPEVVAVKEFSGDVRRIHELAETAPRLDILAGADDVMLELVLLGAAGWIAGYPNALPRESANVYHLAREGRLTEALPAYRKLHPVFRWDSRKEFIQAIKLSMDLVGRYGGPTRLPRLPLPEDVAAQVRKDTEIATGL